MKGKRIISGRELVFRIGMVLVSVLLIALISSLPAIAQENLQKVTLKLNWIPGGDHCFYYVARDLGYYKAEGLDVKIERGRGSGDTVKRVDVGTADIGLADTGTVVIARSEGAKVKIIAMIYSQSPNGIKTRKDTGITTPKDLEGHTVGVPAGDAQRVLWPAFAKANDIDVDKVALVNVAPGAKASVLAGHTVDAVFDWIVGNSAYWRAGLGPDKLVVIPWSKWGMNPYGNALIASEKTIATRSDVLRKFLDATIRAWRWSLLHPREAISIFCKDVTEVPEIDALMRFVEDARLLVDCPAVREHGLGWIDQQRMQGTVEVINMNYALKREVTAKEMYTPNFLPHFCMPSIESLPSLDKLYQEFLAKTKK